MKTTILPLSAVDQAALERESWIDPATAEQFRLHRVTSPEGAALVGRTDHEDYEGIVFPTYWPGDPTPKEYFLRRDHPPMEQRCDGTLKPRQKYLAPPGRGNRLLFGPGESADDLTNTTISIVLVEGLKKTVAAWRLSRHDENPSNFLACGLSGVWNWRGTVGKAPDASGARVDIKGVIADFDRVTWTGRAVTILFDSDTSTNSSVAAARRELVAELRRRGAIVTAPDLPALDELAKTGFDDLLAQWGPERVLAWMHAAQDSAPTADDAEVARLALLPILNYGKARKIAAERWGVPVGFVDAAVKEKKKERAASEDGHGHEIVFEEVLPAFEPVDGAALADALAGVFTKYAVIPHHGDIVLVLWTLFTYCLDLFQISPRLDLSSPEKRCGKTVVLLLLYGLVCRRLLASNVSSAAIYRVIGKHKPTLLLDELETFIQDNEEMRGILNSGHTREAASVLRCDGDQNEVKQFSTWAAYAFAHIGRIPDTLEDRSLRVLMRRKLPRERVAKLSVIGPSAVARKIQFDGLKRQIVRWIEDHSAKITLADPSPIEGLGDRAADNWMPLLAIAEVLGGTWPERARQAALELSGQAAIGQDSIKVELLIDIRDIYSKNGADRMSSADLCAALILLEERPWKAWKNGKPITQAQLSGLLKPFGVVSKSIRIEDQGTLRGYLLEVFIDAFERYISSPTQENPLLKCNTATTRSHSGDDPLSQGATGDSCCTSVNGPNPSPSAECCTVALQKQEIPAEGTFFEEGDASDAH